MPKTGDGDLWPTTDDDTTSSAAKDAETHELPVPDQQEQAEPEPVSEAADDAGATPEKPAAAEPERDEPHGKPDPQITQPVTWPIADLERQVAGSPAWPTAEGGNQKSTALAFTKAEDPGPTPEEQKAPTSIMRPVQRKTEQPPAGDSGEAKDKDGTKDSADTKATKATDDTEAAAEPTTEKPAEKPPADKPAGKPPVEKSAEKPAAEKPGEKPGAEKPGAESPARKPVAERPAEAPLSAKPVEKPAERSAAESPAHRPVAEKPAEAPLSAKPVEKPAERSAAESPAHRPVAEKPAETPLPAKPVEKPVERLPAESPAHKPVAEKPAEAPLSAKPVEKPAEKSPAESPAQKPVAEKPAPEPEPKTRPEKKPEPAKSVWPSEADTGAAKAPEKPARKAAPDEGTKQTPPKDSGGEKPSRGTRPEDAPTNFMRPVQPPPNFRRTPPENRTPPEKRQENAPTSFLRPDNRRPEPPVPNFIRPSTNRDDATGLIPRDAAGAPVFSRPENPTAFIRRDNPPPRNRNADSATVNLSRPEPDRKDDWPPQEPPRAAPQRVGPEPEPAADTEEKSGRSRKPLLIAAISLVAVVAVAAGVVFGVPGLSDKLGITGEDPVAIDPPPGPISYSPALHGPDAAASGPTKQGVEQALAGPMADSALGNVNGVVIDPATGETLYEKNPDSPITPASTGKLLTAATALLSLDPTEQLVTKVVEGDQPGEVIIVGGGDPTISSLKVGNESIYPGAAHLSELVDQVKASGAQVQTVYIDQSRYTAPGLAPSWLPADIAAGYITPIVPAMLDGDRQTDPTENYSPRTTDPGRTLVDEFANRMGASPAASIEKKAPEGAKVLGEIRSAPITQLVDNMLNRSENTLADVLAHEVAVKAGEEPNFDGASKAMLDVLRENQFNVDGVVLRDGSGMSEENKMTARLLAEVLAVAASPDGKDPRTAKLRPLLGGLPVAGGSGTLADRYDAAAAAEGKGWVRAKTGSLTGINSLAGIVLDKDNRPLVFAFLTSGSVATTARPALDAVSATLRGCGCQ